MRTFIFDLDGTLVNSLPDIQTAANKAFHAVNLPPRSLEEVRLHVGHGLDDFIKSINRPHIVTDRELSVIKTVYDEYYKNHLVDLTTVYEGVIDLLEKLRKMGCLLIIASNKTDLYVKIIADKLFAGLFDDAIGQMAHFPPKPRPDLGQYIMDKYGLSAADCVMVGDSKFDTAFAKNCGFYSVGVRWGFSEPGELETAGTDLIVERADEIFDLARIS